MSGKSVGGSMGEPSLLEMMKVNSMDNAPPSNNHNSGRGNQVVVGGAGGGYNAGRAVQQNSFNRPGQFSLDVYFSLHDSPSLPTDVNAPNLRS